MQALERDSLAIRNLRPEDAAAFAMGFAAQGWHKPAEQYQRYYEEQQRGERRVFVAQWDGVLAGYVTLCPKASRGPFAGCPEIVDFNVLKCFQWRGIGNALLDAAEEAAFSFSEVVTLAVGMHAGYGTAQRMYVKRGYLPDGSGLWYADHPVKEGAMCQNDDELMLFFSKRREK